MIDGDNAGFVKNMKEIIPQSCTYTCQYSFCAFIPILGRAFVFGVVS